MATEGSYFAATKAIRNAGFSAQLKGLGVFSGTAKSFGFGFWRKKEKAKQKDLANCVREI